MAELEAGTVGMIAENEVGTIVVKRRFLNLLGMHDGRTRSSTGSGWRPAVSKSRLVEMSVSIVSLTTITGSRASTLFSVDGETIVV